MIMNKRIMATIIKGMMRASFKLPWAPQLEPCFANEPVAPKTFAAGLKSSVLLLLCLRTCAPDALRKAFLFAALFLDALLFAALLCAALLCVVRAFAALFCDVFLCAAFALEVFLFAAFLFARAWLCAALRAAGMLAAILRFRTSELPARPLCIKNFSS